MPSQRKIDIVRELKEKASRAKNMVFTDYQGLTHKQLEQLKKAVKNVDAELVVTKNTLLKRSLENSKLIRQLADQISNIEGPTATLFSYSDIILPLREIAKTIRLLKLPTIKFGIFEGKTITGEEVLRLATLPSREVLIAQVIGQMKAPIDGLHRALSWNIQKLVLTVQVIEKSKGGEK